jgi:uncharacterized membrane protein YbjE (DUF340 family)
LALSSGFGWVTLSSILVSSKLGSNYGAIAMLTDLFRELMAISMLYLLGARFSREAIGICGATALDATLPLIRQKCGTQPCVAGPDQRFRADACQPGTDHDFAAAHQAAPAQYGGRP